MLKHPLQEHIVTVLRYREFARFKDFLLSKTDTNVLSYHIKVLLKLDIIKKYEDTYTFSQNGLVHLYNLTKTDTNCPLITCMILLQNSDGDILLSRQSQQPYINTLTLPMTHVGVDDMNLVMTASRIINEQIGLPTSVPEHIGDAYVRVRGDVSLISSTLVHVFRYNSDEVVLKPGFTWVQPHKLSRLRLMPGTESIIARSFFHDNHFFEEFDEQLLS